jgi:hypothetical protein
LCFRCRDKILLVHVFFSSNISHNFNQRFFSLMQYKLKSLIINLHYFLKLTDIFFHQLMILQQNQYVCTFKTYKPGFPEMDNIFLNSFYFILLRIQFELYFYVDQKLYRHAVYLPFLPKISFDTLGMFSFDNIF